MTPQGAIIKITKIITAISKRDDVWALDCYIASDGFNRDFACVALHRRPGLMRTYSEARARCSERKPVAKAGTVKVEWKNNPALIARLVASWARHDGNAHRVARDLSITEGAAKRAYARYVGATATVNAEKPPRMTQDARDASRLSLGTQPNAVSAQLPRAT